MSQQINLFNPIFLKQKRYFSSVTLLQGLALILIGALGFYGYALYQVRMLETQAKATDRKLAETQQRLTTLASKLQPQQASQQLQAELARLEAELASREEVARILQGGSLGNRAGYSGYLRALARQDMESIWLTGFTIGGAGQDMAIEGRSLNAEDVPVYIQRLSRETLMRGRNFATLEMHTPKPAGNPGVPGADKQPPPFIEFSLRSTESKTQ